MSELAVIIALFGTGLKLDRPLHPARLGRGRPPAARRDAADDRRGRAPSATSRSASRSGAALILGAVLAPTDPVLAGDIGVGPPGEEREHEPNFSITGEAGLNDGLAFPFVFAGAVHARARRQRVDRRVAARRRALRARGRRGPRRRRSASAPAPSPSALRDRRLLAARFDAWLAIPTVLVIYGVAEIAGAYGFIAAFVGGLAFRRYERSHDLNVSVHEGAEVVEKVGELVLVLLVGSMITIAGLEVPGLSGWLLVPALLLADPPALGGRRRWSARPSRPASGSSSPGSASAASARSTTWRSPPRRPQLSRRGRAADRLDRDRRRRRLDRRPRRHRRAARAAAAAPRGGRARLRLEQGDLSERSARGGAAQAAASLPSANEITAITARRIRMGVIAATSR